MKLGYAVVAVLCVLIAFIQLRFLFLPLAQASPDMLHHAAARPLALWTHVAAASVAMAAGVPQFLPRLRTRWRALHRWTGRIYGVAVMLGAVSGFVLGATALGGPVTQTGFATLAFLWGGVTFIALRHAVARRIDLHRRWMIRSFALTFAAVTLRLQVPIWVLSLGTDYTGVLPIIAWTCWVPNLIIAEWLIRRGRGQAPVPLRPAGSA